MAVEARHLNLFPPQILTNRGGMAMNGFEANGNIFGTPMGYGGVVAPSSGITTAAAEALLPMYGLSIDGSAPAKSAVAIKSDSGLTYVPVSRKRPRDEIDSLLSSFPSALPNDHTLPDRCGSFNFFGEDISFQIQQQQLEIDRFIAQHTEKVRTEIEERRKRYTRRIAAAMEENIMKKLKAKEDEIEKIGKLNWALEESVKSLCVENQIWRDLAQTNEATANALRCNLEQVLAAREQDEQQRHQGRRADDAALADDAQSCCGSNSDEIDRRALPGTNTNDVNSRCMVPSMEKNRGSENDISTSYSNRRISGGRICRGCEREESSVLLLPCRHLCLCTVCGSSAHSCPVCHSIKTASVHVNLYS